MNATQKLCRVCKCEWLECCAHRCFCGETQEEDGFYWDEYNKRIHLPNDANLLKEYKENNSVHRRKS